MTTTIPDDIEKKLSCLTASQKALVKKLYELGQSHLFEKWGSDETTDKIRKGLASQLEALDKAYQDGGLEGYIKNARKLLEDSAKGVNPLDGWEPSVPQGETFELGTPEYSEAEQNGMNELGNVGFVLVAGGLGERLGYSDIKVRSEMAASHFRGALWFLIMIAENCQRLVFQLKCHRKPATFITTLSTSSLCKRDMETARNSHSVL